MPKTPTMLGSKNGRRARIEIRMLQCKEPIPEVLRHCNIPRRAPRRGPVTNSLEDVGWIRTDPARLIGNGPLADNLRAEYFGPWKIWAEMEPNLRWSDILDKMKKYFQR